ncbi:MAG: hypothetical protein KF887_10735 [Paracoccaceae bacterium]|nr:MAG: hypothetical protein KF887_10735 [Paracoccaceae bacterium]
MKLKLTLAAIALALTPGLAAAMCKDGHTKITASACGEGQVYDAASGACVLKPTS